MKMKIECLIVFIVISIISPLSQVVADTNYPNRFIEVVIPYGPGGNSNLSLKSFKDRVAKILGQPIVEVFKPGAAAAIGMNYVKAAAPDGYTMVVTSYDSMNILYLSQKATFSYKDFEPICSITTAPMVLCVNVNSPYKTMQDLIMAARTEKGKIKYSTIGNLSAPHIIMEAFSREANFKATQIPFAGGSAAMTAVLGEHTDLSICNATGIESQLRILATIGKKRSPMFPAIPTLVEIGYPSISYDTVFSLWAPKGTPKEITNKVYSAHKKALEEYKEEITKTNSLIGNVPFVMGPEELLEYTKNADTFFRKAIEQVGLVK
jgi:tripartite-type tricarboxylate transporter receptor subunit TctC